MRTDDSGGTGGTGDRGGPGGTADADHDNANKQVVAVGEDDTERDVVNRLEAHTGEGIRHRAFTILVFDAERNLLLAQRSPDKRLWDGFWDGTVASHPEQGQTQTEATRQRLRTELGVAPDQYRDLRVTDKFEYKRYYLDEGVEHEVCTVLQCRLVERALDPDESEVAGLLWVPYERLHEHPRWYRQLRLCPWFEIAVRRDVS